MNKRCANCHHDEMDHIQDPMTKIAWCGICHDEWVDPDWSE